METISESTNTLQSLSQDLARVVERVSTAVVAINARRNSSSSGVCWRDGVIVTAAHTLRRTEDISVILPRGEAIAATLARADPSRSQPRGRTTLQLSFLSVFLPNECFPRP
jgi:serine protease Do